MSSICRQHLCAQCNPFFKGPKPFPGPFFHRKGQKVLKSAASSPRFEAGKVLIALSEAVPLGPIPLWCLAPRRGKPTRRQTPHRAIRASGDGLAFQPAHPPDYPRCAGACWSPSSTAITSALACFILLRRKNLAAALRCGGPATCELLWSRRLTREARAGHTWLTRG